MRVVIKRLYLAARAGLFGALLLGSIGWLTACGSNITGASCGPGTTLAGGTCTTANSADASTPVTCGPGTILVGDECVLGTVDAGPSVSCGSGTVLVAGKCLPTTADAGPSVSCGSGTVLVAGKCLPTTADASPSVSCGSGTVLVAGKCMPRPVDAGPVISCGPGTRLLGDTCVPIPDGGGAAAFIVRVNATTLGADGYTTIPVTIVGTNADGSPSTASLVVGTSRPGAGTLSPAAVTLAATGATVYFTACDAASSTTCTGPMHITVALASAPTTVVAESQELDLVTQTGVGSDAPCLIGGNVLYLDGDQGSLNPGIMTITQGTWSGSASSSHVEIQMTPTGTTTGSGWTLDFDTSQLPNPTMMTQVYTMVMRWPFVGAGHPGLDITGHNEGCNTETGSFQVEKLVSSGGSLTSFTATFEHHCDGDTAALRGCVHIGN